MRRTSRTALFAALLGLPAGPGRAELADLRRALEQVPAAVLLKPDAVQAAYTDFADLRALPSTETSGPHRFRPRFSPSLQSDTLQALDMGDGATWEEKTGLPMAELSSFLVFDTPDGSVTIWRFHEAGRMRSFLAGLERRGFAKDRDGSLTNGELGSLNLERADPANPFGGIGGQSSMLAEAGGGVAQSYDAKPIAALRSPTGPGFGMLPQVAAALDGLAKVAGTARLPQAMVLGVGAWAADPFQGPASGPPVQPPRPPEGGPPPALAAIVADIEDADRRGAILSIGYPDCGTAAKAGATFAEIWRTAPDLSKETPLQQTGAEPVTSEVSGSGGCAAVISLTTRPTGSDGNPVYAYLAKAVLQRDLKALSGR